MKCLELIQKLSLPSDFVKVPIASSVPQSPIGVLDAACLCYRTDGSGVESCANSSRSSPVKRRKLNTPYEVDGWILSGRRGLLSKLLWQFWCDLLRMQCTPQHNFK